MPSWLYLANQIIYIGYHTCMCKIPTYWYIPISLYTSEYNSEPLPPPTVLTVLEITSSSLTVSWRPPLGQLEEENTIHYLINMTDTKGKSVVNEVNSTVLSIRVPELLPDHLYQVAVAAVSGERVGPSTTLLARTRPATGVYVYTYCSLHCIYLLYNYV